MSGFHLFMLAISVGPFLVATSPLWPVLDELYFKAHPEHRQYFPWPNRGGWR